MHGKCPSNSEMLGGVIGCDPTLISVIAENPNEHYRRFPIRSKRKRPRWISAPSGNLKAIQRSILDELLYKIEPHASAHGFYPGRSIITNAQLHTKKCWVISMDIKDFFTTTSKESVLETIAEHGLGYNPQLWELVVSLCCLDDCLPQGAPTSPHLANLCFIELDKCLVELADSNNLSYSRYADDMTFSGTIMPPNMTELVQGIIAKCGYELAKEKTKIMGRNKRQTVTGLVVNDKVTLPRTLRRKLRAIRHAGLTCGWEEAILQSDLVDSENEYWGYFALQTMVSREIPNHIRIS